MSQATTENSESSRIFIREYTPKDESEVLALIQQGMGGGLTGKREEAFWRWKHFNNPFGPSIALLATSASGQIIGLRTFMRWRFLSGDFSHKAVRAVDTVTHPDFRRYGIFSKLTLKGIESAKNDGVDFIFNTPNEQVLPGYLKLGWSYVSLLRPLVRILNYPRFVTGLIRSRDKSHSSGPISADEIFKQQLPSISEFLGRTKGFETLLQSHRRVHHGKLVTDQSLDYLKWRYGQHPDIDYKVLYTEKNGAVSGCAILRPSTRFGLKEVIINELILSGADDGSASNLLHELRRLTKADYIIAYFSRGSFQRAALARNGFYQVPKAGQNFTVKLLSQSFPRDPQVLNNWELSLGDLEMF
jgi:hypothetical protein